MTAELQVAIALEVKERESHQVNSAEVKDRARIRVAKAAQGANVEANVTSQAGVDESVEENAEGRIERVVEVGNKAMEALRVQHQ